MGSRMCFIVLIEVDGLMCAGRRVEQRAESNHFSENMLGREVAAFRFGQIRTHSD